MSRLRETMGRGRHIPPGCSPDDMSGPTDEGFIRRKAAHDRHSPRCRGSWAVHGPIRALGPDWCYCCGEKF